MSLDWYVLRTEPRGEYLAAAELESDGFQVFFPRVNTPNSRVGHDDLPLFPGYIFLRCDPQTRNTSAVCNGWLREWGKFADFKVSA